MTLKSVVDSDLKQINAGSQCKIDDATYIKPKLLMCILTTLLVNFPK